MFAREQTRDILAVAAVMVATAVVVFLVDFALEQEEQGQACTQEAKLCPDGSAVGRTGPTCEFAPCPMTGIKNEELGSKVNNDSMYWSVKKDRKDNQVKVISLADISIPLNSSEACILAKEGCGSQECLQVFKQEAAIPEDIKMMFGDFQWQVDLKPVCGGTVAYIDEKEKEVLCFCAYE